MSSSPEPTVEGTVYNGTLSSGDGRGTIVALVPAGPSLEDENQSVSYARHPRVSAVYDYASEKSLSHVDSRLFYQNEQIVRDSAGSMISDNFTPSSPIGTKSKSSWKVTTTPDQRQGDGHHPPLFVLTSRSPQPGKDTNSSLSGLDSNIGAAERDSNNVMRQAQKSHRREAGLSNSEMPQGQRRDDILHSPIEVASTGLSTSTKAHVSESLAVTNEFSQIYSNIQKICDARHKYMRLSLQEFGSNPKDEPSWAVYPPPPEPAWKEELRESNASQAKVGAGEGNQHLSRSASLSVGNTKDDPKLPLRRRRKPGQDIGEDFEFSDLLPLPDDSEMTFKLDECGVYQVYENSKSAELESPILAVPTIRDFYMDLDSILQISSEGPTKSFAFRRLQYLEGKFNLYSLLNEYEEIADSKRVPHRDFYNVRKVDTHVHHSSCMNQKHLLRFIKSKMKKCPDEVVMYRDSKHMTLKEVFESINLTAYDLSIDTLDMHVRINRALVFVSPCSFFV